MTTETSIVPQEPITPLAIPALEHYLETGDISELSGSERVGLLQYICQRLGLETATRPVQYIAFDDGRVQLYYTKDASAQLSRNHGVSVRVVERWREDGNYYMLAEATDATGRCVQEIGGVSLTGHRKDGGTWELNGDSLANAIMRCSTKAKRRAVLSFCGLGGLDETELETIPRTRISEDSARALPAIDPGPDPLRELIVRAQNAGFNTPNAILRELGDERNWADASREPAALLDRWLAIHPTAAPLSAMPESLAIPRVGDMPGVQATPKDRPE